MRLKLKTHNTVVINSKTKILNYYPCSNSTLPIILLFFQFWQFCINGDGLVATTTTALQRGSQESNYKLFQGENHGTNNQSAALFVISSLKTDFRKRVT